MGHTFFVRSHILQNSTVAINALCKCTDVFWQKHFSREGQSHVKQCSSEYILLFLDEGGGLRETTCYLVYMLLRNSTWFS